MADGDYNPKSRQDMPAGEGPFLGATQDEIAGYLERLAAANARAAARNTEGE